VGTGWKAEHAAELVFSIAGDMMSGLTETSYSGLGLPWVCTRAALGTFSMTAATIAAQNVSEVVMVLLA